MGGVWRVFKEERGNWHELSILESATTMQKINELRSISSMVETELKNEVTPGRLQPYSEVTSSDIEIIPGKEEELYQYALESIADTHFKDLRDFLKAWGVEGTEAQDLFEKLQESKGPNGEDSWLPDQVGDKEFTFLQSDKYTTSFALRQSPLVRNREGVQLDSMYFMLVTNYEYRNNPFTRAYLDVLLRDNENNPDSLLFWGALGEKYLRYGLQLTSDNRLAFVVMNQEIHWRIDSQEFNDVYAFGNKEGQNLDLDLRRYTALYRNYWEIFRKLDRESSVGYPIDALLSLRPMCISANTSECQVSEDQLLANIYTTEPLFEFK